MFHRSVLLVGVVGGGFYAMAQTSLSAQEPKTKVVVVGSGTAGITLTSQLMRKDPTMEVTIVSGAQKHYYQPLWSLVGAGLKAYGDSERDTESIIPAGARWVQEDAAALDPTAKKVVTQSGKEVPYDYLVLAAGLTTDWDGIPGLQENLAKNGVVSNYAGGQCTWEAVRSLPKDKDCTVLFTFPSTTTKCGGAPQKAMYMSEDYWKHQGYDMKRIHISFCTPSGAMFPVKKYCSRLQEICEERGIHQRFGHALTAIEVSPDGARRTAVFTVKDPKDAAAPPETVRLPFDILHVGPPMSAPRFLRGSPVANAQGFVEVDQATLQSPKFPNVFGLGDCSSLPTSKTAAAVCKQVPVAVRNLLDHKAGRPLSAKYNGYTSCPLLTGAHPRSLLMMEFGYGGEVMESLPWDQGHEGGLRGRFHYLLKDTVFPFVYWNLLLKGRWYGPTGPFEPSMA